MCGTISSASAGEFEISGVGLNRKSPRSLYRPRITASTFGVPDVEETVRMPCSGDGRFSKPGICFRNAAICPPAGIEMLVFTVEAAPFRIVNARLTDAAAEPVFAIARPLSAEPGVPVEKLSVDSTYA